MEFHFECQKLTDAGKAEGPVVAVDVARGIDVEERIGMFRPSKSETSKERNVEIYSRATYLKYQSAMREFGDVAESLDEWLRRRSEPVERRRETLLLLEASTGVPDETGMFVPQVVGALLLRSGWSNDVVIDFLVVNGTLLDRVAPRLRVGPVLVAAACVLAQASDAGHVMVETAHHTREYWRSYLPQGNWLWRHQVSTVAARNAARTLNEAGWIYLKS